MPRVTRLLLDATCATNIYLCHIVQPRVKRFIKHFSAIQIVWNLLRTFSHRAVLRPVPAAALVALTYLELTCMCTRS